MQTTHIVITELNDSSPHLASHATYMNSSINLKYFYNIAPVLYHSINYIVNQFKTMNVFYRYNSIVLQLNWS